MSEIDILNREEFVESLFNLTENISNNQSSICFALNGEWGIGKSFVLNMFEEKLDSVQSPETCNNKYFVIRYNSWKYDYYNEPLVAIVATMISTIEDKTKLFPESERKQEILGMLKAIGVSLLSIGNNVIREKTGLDFQKAYQVVSKGKNDGNDTYAKEHNYDVYFGFNKVLDKLVKLIQSLEEMYTVVIIVDELDRCIPEYAVKVLERLHHLIEQTNNTITIISIDKKQLMSSVKQIFGFDNPEKYLEKFFSFEIKLDYGKRSAKIVEKYSSYIELFDKEKFQFDDSIEECLQNIFNEIDIRTQEQIISKVMLAHKLLYKDKKDYSFMCMELILGVIVFVYNENEGFFKKTVNLECLEKVFLSLDRKTIPSFANFFTEKFKHIRFETRREFRDELLSYILCTKNSLYGAILYTWYWLHEIDSYTIIKHFMGDSYTVISKNHEDLKKFIETIKMMR